MAGNWTDPENDAIVADYFAMLSADLAGHEYSKAAHNRGLQVQTGRTKGSIEFKHRNISAVLQGLGESWLNGYLPAFNIQDSLVDAVVRWLTAHPHWGDPPPPPGPMAVLPGLREETALWIGPPPTHRNAPPPNELKQMQAIAVKFDVAARDARNRALGRAGEMRILAHERASLMAAGRGDLADRVRWVSDLDGDGAGYDIQSFESDGQDRLIEVKTTNGWERTPFHMTRRELDIAEQCSDTWRLVRLWNFRRAPNAFELRPPLDAHISLMATGYLASLR